MELLIARNPDEASTLPYLMLLPLGSGLAFRVRDTWPRTSAVYCHPVPVSEWPERPDVVVREPLRSCQRRGAAIDLVLTRTRENRSQLVFTRARGRDVVFWQSRRTRRQTRPSVRAPRASAPGAADLTVIVDAHERYAYSFVDKPVAMEKRALPAGDYGVAVAGRLVAAVERKSADDFVSSLASSRLRYALGELSALPRAAVVVEDRYSALLKQQWMRPGAVANGLAELQIRYPTVPIVFCETRSLAEEYVYRFLAAARVWALDDSAVADRLGDVVLTDSSVLRSAPAAPDLVVTAAQVRAWAQGEGLVVSDKGRIPASVLAAYRAAHAEPEEDAEAADDVIAVAPTPSAP